MQLSPWDKLMQAPPGWVRVRISRDANHVPGDSRMWWVMVADLIDPRPRSGSNHPWTWIYPEPRRGTSDYAVYLRHIEEIE